MLTRQLGIAQYDFENGRVIPDRLTQRTHARYLAYSERMLEAYRGGVGSMRQELHREVHRILAGDTACPVRRSGAFCKLLDDASVYAVGSRGSAATLRREVFRRAARLHPATLQPDRPFRQSQTAAKATIAAELGLPWSQIDQQLFADVVDFQRLSRFDGYTDGPALLSRYNVAQVQCALYDAQCLEVEARDDFKTILRYAKLARLMHVITRSEPGCYQIRLDGPASMLRKTRRYGVALATFFPALVACRDWRLRATLLRKGWTLALDLSAADGLHSHLPSPETFDSQLEATFATAWESKSRDGWTLHREGELLHRGQKVFVPDFALRHSDGHQVLLEIVGFWTPEYLQAKIETLRAFPDARTLLAVAESLRQHLPPLPHPSISFKKSLPVEAVLAALHRHWPAT